MKKIIIAGILMLAFGVSVNAQNKKSPAVAEKKEVVSMTPEQAAKKDAQAISEFLSLDNTKTVNFESLFRMKHQMMQDKSSTPEARKEMSRIVGLKIEASIDSKLYEKLRSNRALYSQLLSVDAIEKN